ncbi:hypothetical protein BBBOND_0203170 [Babesia bigemina]|uniref:Uncharacterized protein n=1 Tax=Babesia bigemina TaxID=5866 RepID=A0A061DBN5_BABBI|nr:hypothetical protein BBBOND_0203170 [Babesia bigemina]CDR95160.1 hypothetical protein BBBOND_0203170 [Babesia bigemina]|eukprot:XP_012767346.1 hypothetical protein BBBOND_0203170 [Babesia bigemina]
MVNTIIFYQYNVVEVTTCRNKVEDLTVWMLLKTIGTFKTRAPQPEPAARLYLGGVTATESPKSHLIRTFEAPLMSHISYGCLCVLFANQFAEPNNFKKPA